MDAELADTIAAAVAACAVLDLADVVPAEWREAVREKIHTAALAAVDAYADLGPKSPAGASPG